MASGSEKRQRTASVMVRFTPAERATLDAAAERGGLSLGGYVRAVLLGAEPLRQSRRPPAERAELVRMLGQLGKIGSNINQIAHVLNSGGDTDPPELAGVRDDIAVMRAAIMGALGREPGEGAP